VLPDGSPNDRELTWASIISERVVLEAAKGNPAIIKELLDRCEGKVRDKLDVNQRTSGPTIQIVKFADIQDRLGKGDNKPAEPG